MMGRTSQEISPRRAMVAIGVLTLCAFVWPAVLTFDPGDWPSPDQFPHHDPAVNACGLLGAWTAYQLRYWLGDGAYPLLLFATLAAFLRLVRGQIGHRLERAFGLALLVVCTSASAHLLAGAGPGSLSVGHGGVIGFAAGELLRQHLDRLGTLIVLVASTLVALIFTTQGWVLRLPGAAMRAGQAAAGATANVGKSLAERAASFQRTVAERETIGPAGVEGPSGIRGPAETTDEEADQDALDANERASTSGVKTDSRTSVSQPLPIRTAEFSPGEAANASSSRSEKAGSGASRGLKRAAQVSAETGHSPGAAPGPIVRFAGMDDIAPEPYPRQIENWRLPSLDLLRPAEHGYSDQHESFVRRQAQVLEQTLEEFRIDARVVEIDTGPVITMFELTLGAGVKVSQIASLSNDVARALRAPAIRVVAPISGKNTVGIEVPNVEKERVRLRELVTLAGKRASEMGLPLFLGKDAGGSALVADLTRMPHLLIAGTTGSGKSVCLNSMIVSLLMTKRPDHVKMILIDPKMVEMSQFKDTPHLMCPIVTDMTRAEKILEWAVTKMDERYELLAEARVKNIQGYNALGAEGLYARLKPESEQERACIATHLPYIVIVIDELADLMMTSAKEVEHHLSRLAQKSRAVGIHIIVATQRPEARVVTGLIKSNLPCRICFRVASRMDSRIVLDQNGGEVLLGQGDMLFLPPGSHKLIRAQGTFLDDAEVHAVLDDLASRAQPEFHPELMRLRVPGASESDPSMRDPLFNRAVRIILESQRGSVSLLQRRLLIGYSRASRLVDQMAEAGIVGDYKGSQAREVRVTLEQWEEMLRQAEGDDDAPDETGAPPRRARWDDERELADSRL